MLTWRIKTAGLEAINQLAEDSGLSRSEVLREIFKEGFPIVQRKLKKKT